ncbi:hypothetical protein OVY01_21760 [Robbsia sp. Bb-Pol-6]|uniref:Uncharacterized protein n=1 Tax=Robbsia betulipollinis TaxID=2981849 RepID=A0ABT3ZTH0_9BURK|nr:hypothetical protein [Robbsia betulipollinis]MCY0389772.1 hypothetical protein [Robbsia betulipollinis]
MRDPMGTHCKFHEMQMSWKLHAVVSWPGKPCARQCPNGQGSIEAIVDHAIFNNALFDKAIELLSYIEKETF